MIRRKNGTDRAATRREEVRQQLLAALLHLPEMTERQLRELEDGLGAVGALALDDLGADLEQRWDWWRWEPAA